MRPATIASVELSNGWFDSVADGELACCGIVQATCIGCCDLGDSFAQRFNELAGPERDIGSNGAGGISISATRRQR